MKNLFVYQDFSDQHLQVVRHVITGPNDAVELIAQRNTQTSQVVG